MNPAPSPAAAGTNREPPPVGLFDFERLEDLADTLSETLQLPIPIVYERLFHEALQTGWNVRRNALEFGVTPHVYNETMEAFYRETDAFVFELVVIHQHPACIEIDRRVVAAVEEHADRLGRHPALLLLGDGIGSDSLRFAVAGYPVTYFEFQGRSASFATARFKRRDLWSQIRMLHELGDIPRGSYDCVVCREVLEHVNDPPRVIADIWDYLAPQGIAVITESFGRVEPQFPTHLVANLRYHGRTDRLFVEAGFRLLHAYPHGRPLVFQKTDKEDASRFRSLPGNSRVRRFIRGARRRLFSLISR
jgi:SAM-dependent methyltransferase